MISASLRAHHTFYGKEMASSMFMFSLWAVIVKILLQILLRYLTNISDLVVMLSVDDNVILEAEIVKRLRCLLHHVDVYQPHINGISTFRDLPVVVHILLLDTIQFIIKAFIIRISRLFDCQLTHFFDQIRLLAR